MKGIMFLNTNGHKLFPQGGHNLQHGEMVTETSANLIMIALISVFQWAGGYHLAHCRSLKNS